MYLVTDRLIIRDFCMSDANDLHEILGDAETMKYCEPAYTFEQTQRFLLDFCIVKKGAFAVVQRSTQKVIGYILFNAIEKSIYEIGWIFNKNFWRQGFAYEACSNLITYAFEKSNINKIIAETTDRQKSIALMEKLGMTFKELQKEASKDNLGKLVDMYIYEITRS